MNLHNHDIVARDPLHTLDNDTYGIKYLKSHSINELFAELTGIHIFVCFTIQTYPNNRETIK